MTNERAMDCQCARTAMSSPENGIARSSTPFRKTFAFVPRLLTVAFAAFLGAFIAYPAFGQASKAGASASTRYVSAQGSDSRNGLSWNAAKQSISAAVRSCPAFGPCTINVSSLLLSSPLVIRRPDTTIRCTSGATISTDVRNGAPITVRAGGFQLTGCMLDYSGGVGNTVVAVPHSVSHVTIDHNVFRNYVGRPSYVGVVHLGNRTNRSVGTAVTDVRITNNQFLNVDPMAINLQDDVFRVTISNNVIATDVSRSNSPTINAQTSDPDAALESITITNNEISKGTHNNCFQVQNLAYGNATIQNVTVSGNACRLKPNAGAGTGASGYSMAGIVGLTETGNVFKGNGQTISGNAPFELVSCQRVMSSQNIAMVGNAISRVNVFTIIGSRSAVSRDVTLRGDFASMAVHGTASGSCYHVYADQGARMEHVMLTGDSCDLSGSRTRGTLRGIWVQSGGTRAAILGGSLSGNVITGATGAAVWGIHMEPGAGTISGWQVGQNRFRNTRRDVVGRQGGGR